ncbi:MAG: hypothetical protein LBP43_06620, partial [Treponema sp.]|nr:hypothetical protein [Treponema sp.]
GQSLAVDYGITRFLSAGIKWGFSQNFYQVQAFEPEAFIRFYAGSFLFFQADMGASITLKDYQPYLFILGGITAGVRVPVDHWYVEPYIRGGYPFMAGAGVSAGYRF